MTCFVVLVYSETFSLPVNFISLTNVVIIFR